MHERRAELERVQGIAAGLVQQLDERHVRFRAECCPYKGRDVAASQRRQPKVVTADTPNDVDQFVKVGRCGLRAECRDERHRKVGEATGDCLHRAQRCGVGPVQVFEQEHEWHDGAALFHFVEDPVDDDELGV